MTFAYRFIWTWNDSTSTASKISIHYMFDLKTLHARPSFVWANLCKCSNIDTNMIVSVWWRSTFCFSYAWRPSRLLYDIWSISHLHERPSPTPSVHRAVKAWGYANRRLRNARFSHSESKWTKDRFSNPPTKICSNCLKSVVQSEDFNQKFATIRQEIFAIGDLGRAEIHFLTITDRLAAECFERAQPFSSSPSLGPRSFATRSR